MRLLLDENLSPSQASALRVDGYDAVSIVEMGLAGMPDPQVRNFAIQENRILVTLDADFANMLRFPPAGTPGVIRLKVHPPVEVAIRLQLQKTLILLKDMPMAGRLAVSHGDMIRIRS